MPSAPMPDDWQRALVIAAHPDDIEYGLAAVVAVWTAAGKEVHYLLATRGEAGVAGLPAAGAGPPAAAGRRPSGAGPLRAAEVGVCAAVGGVSEVEFLDQRDGLLENGPGLRR